MTNFSKDDDIKYNIILESIEELLKKPEEEFVKINRFLIDTYTSEDLEDEFKLPEENFFFLKLRLKYLKKDVLSFTEFLKNYEIFDDFYKNKIKLIHISHYYASYYYKRINFIDDKRHINHSNYSILILNLLNQKPIINLIFKNKLALNLTSGILKKKLEIKEKNIKKSPKMLKLMLKISSFNIKKIFLLKTFIIQLKGAKSKIPQTLTLLNRYLKPVKFFFIFTPKIINNKLKFKKVKAIKRKLKKKFVKM